MALEVPGLRPGDMAPMALEGPGVRPGDMAPVALEVTAVRSGETSSMGSEAGPDLSCGRSSLRLLDRSTNTKLQ